MKTLVIHPLDPTTGFLEPIYSDIDCTVIDKPNQPKRDIVEAIKNHDRIIMLGHGTEQGLLAGWSYIISPKLVYLLREKECVCIWCNADKFVEKYELKGFYSGMMISELDEADMFKVRSTEVEINYSNMLFTSAVKEAIQSENMVETALELYTGDTEVIKYNRERIYETR